MIFYALFRSKAKFTIHKFHIFIRFSDVPCDIVSFTLTVHNKGKRGKEQEVAELHVELSSLGNGEEREEWYTLSGLTPMGEWGSLRLRTR